MSLSTGVDVNRKFCNAAQSRIINIDIFYGTFASYAFAKSKREREETKIAQDIGKKTTISN